MARGQPLCAQSQPLGPSCAPTLLIQGRGDRWRLGGLRAERPGEPVGSLPMRRWDFQGFTRETKGCDLPFFTQNAEDGSGAAGSKGAVSDELREGGPSHAGQLGLRTATEPPPN